LKSKAKGTANFQNRRKTWNKKREETKDVQKKKKIRAPPGLTRVQKNENDIMKNIKVEDRQVLGSLAVVFERFGNQKPSWDRVLREMLDEILGEPSTASSSSRLPTPPPVNIDVIPPRIPTFLPGHDKLSQEIVFETFLPTPSGPQKFILKQIINWRLYSYRNVHFLSFSRHA